MLKENEKEFICEIEIPQFLEYIRLSEKRNPKYYIKNKGKKIPEKYKTPNFVYKGKGKDNQLCLFDIENDKYVIANPKAVGTPKEYKINGQAFYSGNISEFTRIKVVEAIKESFYPYIKDLKFEKEYPLIIECGVYYPVSKYEWDVDNKVWIYNKCMQDLLVKSGILREDNRLFITGAAGGIYFPVESIDDRKLVYRFSYDLRNELSQLKLNLYDTENNKEDF